MYLRFVITQLDEDSRRPKGLFTAAYQVLDAGQAAHGDGTKIRQLLDWFNDNLPAPPDSFTADRALYWFKSSGAKAKECVDRMWELNSLVGEAGYHVEVHKCRKLTNIRYEDDYQVAAYPSPNDARTTIG